MKIKNAQSMNNERRTGAFLAFTLFVLIATAGFLSMSVDLSVVSVTRVRMQNAADAAALAAAQEISIALDEVSSSIAGGGDVGGGMR
ncbi:MAG: pilus assembly protein TadG-related protein [Planctomycetaceae bacterium]